ncbi:MAG: asparaginase [Candidatus Thorarchaeota archaeon]
MSEGSDRVAVVSLITTGGTIGSVYDPATQALRPGLSIDALLDSLPRRLATIQLEKHELFQLDSANAQPHHWQEIAAAIKQVHEESPDLAGIVVTHGTDTMVYSATAVSFMLQNFGKPIVFTGAQVPATVPWSDGARNLVDAIRVAALADLGETCIVFNGEIHRPSRTKKVRTNAFDAFDSVDPYPLGMLSRDIVLHQEHRRRQALIPNFDTRLDDRIFLLKIFPGMPPRIITQIVDMGCRGLVLEGFGSGNIPTGENSLLGSIRQAVDQGCTVVVSSQCAFGQADLSLYEMGKEALDAGAISARDMTSEATLVKLAWVLGHTHDPARVKEMMYKNFVNEFTMSAS